MALGQGADHVDKIPDPVRVDRQHDAEGRSEPRRPTTTSSTVSANGAQRAAAADEDLSLRPPLDALPIIRPLTLLRIRGQAVHGGGSGTVRSSSDTAAASADQGNEDNVPSSSSSGSSDESSICSSSGADVDPFAVTRDKSGRCECMDRMQVNNKIIPISEAANHYCINLVNEAATRAYRGFRPVRGDGDCFYRSFIFSYVEQVLCRHDTFEESRILAAVEGVAKHYAHLRWPSNFSTGHKAFVKLMKKVMKWKIQRNIKASSSSYCGQKLLKFSNSCKKMKPVIVFLRSVAAIWICSHREHYEHLIPELEEGHGLEDWCFLHVIPCHEWADHVQMIAVGTALEVSIRVINLNKGPAQDVYTHQGVPRVDVLFTGNHYDVIYPRQLSDKSVPLPEAANTLQSKSHGEVEAVSQPSAANDLHIQSLPGIADAASLLIRSVWSHNCEEELDALLSVVRHGNVTIAIDMEFASTAGKQKNPETTAEWYSNIHALVNGGDILQFGLAIFLDSSSTQAEHVCEINLKFDVNSCSYNEGTIKFLEKAKYNLESHNINGVLPARLAKWVLHEFDRLYDREITWVVFQGDADIGFLLKLLGNVMPETRLEYLQRHNCSLPHLYDVRVLARILFGGYVKGLSSVAASLKVKRFGKEHSSGSDALLTLDCFLELKKRLGSGKVHQYRGVMAGIFMVDRIVNEALPIGHENVHVVEVWDHNLQEEVQLIVQAVQNNYCIVGVDGCFVPALHPMPFHKDQQACLNHIIEALKAVCSYEISVALVSYTGQIPQGKWWRFHVSEYSYPYCSMPGAPRHVHFLKFADMLKSCGLLGNPKITWGAFEGAEVFASLYHMVQRGTKADFPLHALQYRRRRSLMFPFLRDVRLLVSPEKATSLVEIAQELGLSVPHKQSEWKAMLIAQLLAQFRDMLGYSDTILKAYADHNGHLLSKCCSHSGFYC